MSLDKLRKGRNVRRVEGDRHFDEVIKKASSVPKTPAKEKPYASELNNLGRKAYFDEYFYEIKLEDQVFPKVGEFENPSETYSFKQGYQRGEFLVNNGIVPEEYQNINNSKKHR